MIKVMQYGEGNFLRTFVDHYFNTLNNEGLEYEVNIVKPIMFGSLERFVRQNNKYHIVLRGCINNNDVEDVYAINCVKNVLSPFEEYEKYMALSVDKDLRIIVSNTTEAGICFNENDDMNSFDNITYPAKLTKFLFNRFNNKLEGLYLLPVELIENNADELLKCVLKYIELWNLENEFKEWILNECVFVNTLVDRIVSGYPKDEITKNHLTELIGENDDLVSIGEPFGLWAIEDKKDIKKYIVEGRHGIDVVLTKNIAYYKVRKVRVLNGSHTNLVPCGLFHGMETVYDCMNDVKVSNFVKNTLDEEIIPFVSKDIEMTKEFAESVMERFKNPYLNHQLVSISLNSISKWVARDLPSFKDYYNYHQQLPKYLTIGFSYLMALYSNVYEKEGKYYVDLPNRTIELKDDVEYLNYFVNKGSIENFMKNKKIFSLDLSTFNGFVEEVVNNVNKINNGISLI